MKHLQIILLFLLLACTNVFAQEYFVYEDETVIVRLTEDGIAHIRQNGSITIPSHVTKVCQGAFSQLSSYHTDQSEEFETLIIEGNPYFEKADEDGRSALDETNSGEMESNLTTIEMGSSMSEANMQALLLCLESQHSLKKVEIKGEKDGNIGSLSWTSEPIKAVLTNDVRVMLPATQVTNQVFGNAKVYGVFETAYEYSTTCVGATFVDMDDGSNFLFYIPTETTDSGNDKKVVFKRVHYINANAGVLIHYEEGTSTRAELLRIDNVATYVAGLEGDYKTIYDTDQANYGKNMLKGSINPQTIGATDGEYTNMVLYNGAFVRTSGGTLGANRAYLRVPTASLSGVSSGAKLMMVLDDEITGIGSLTPDPLPNGEGNVYDLQGRKVADNCQLSIINYQLPKGIYIHNGKKIVRK